MTVVFDSVDVISILGRSSFVGLLRQQPGSIQCLTFTSAHMPLCPSNSVSTCFCSIPLNTSDTALLGCLSIEYKLHKARDLVLFTALFLALRTVLNK